MREPPIQLEEEIKPNIAREKNGIIADLEKTPIRVANPVINDENFLRENIFIVRSPLRVSIFEKEIINIRRITS